MKSSKKFVNNMVKKILIAGFRYVKFKWLNFRLRLAVNRRPLKITVGAGGTSQKGWVSTDIEHLNLLDELTWARYFKESSVDAIIAEHVWEHLAADEAVVAIKHCFSYLKRDGYIRIAVPDGFHPSPQYIDAVKPGGSGDGSDDHKALYNYKTITELIRKAGFEVKLLEWYDQKGKFHFVDWSPETGMIWRSSRFDQRNKDNKLNYTSLIVDAIKL
ncbi:MAG: hypothetical protein R6W72_07610 [Desulfurivibrionaceae bacterium]